MGDEKCFQAFGPTGFVELDDPYFELCHDRSIVSANLHLKIYRDMISVMEHFCVCHRAGAYDSFAPPALSYDGFD